MAGVPAGLFRLLPHLPSCAPTAPSSLSHPVNLTRLETFALPFPRGRTYFPLLCWCPEPAHRPGTFRWRDLSGYLSKLALTSCSLSKFIIAFQTYIAYPFSSYLRSSHLIYRQNFCPLLGVWKGVSRNKQQVRKQRSVLGDKFVRTGERSQARKLGGGPVRAGGTTRSGDKYHSVTQLNEEAFLGRNSWCKKRAQALCL